MSRLEKSIAMALELRDGKSKVSAEKSARDKGMPLRPPVQVDLKKVNPHIVALHDPKSATSEEYRKLKSSISRLTKQDGFRNVMMVSSCLSEEGKSITALNLAVALSRELDHSVLLIDGDLRRPSLHRYLGIRCKKGLTDCLIDDIEPASVIIRTDIDNLSLLPAGKRVDNPFELLSSRKMSELTKEMKYRYTDRYIIFDTPPILPFAETRLLGSLTDGMILVVREGTTSIEQIREAIAMLKDVTIYGIVYNNARMGNLNDRYNYYKYYDRYMRDRKGK